MIEIKVRSKNGLEPAIKALRRKVDRDGALKDARKKQRYEKPSRKRYEKKKRAKYIAKLQAKEDRLWR